MYFEDITSLRSVVILTETKIHGGSFKETYDICGTKYHIFFAGTDNAVLNHMHVAVKLWTDYKGEFQQQICGG